VLTHVALRAEPLSAPRGEPRRTFSTWGPSACDSDLHPRTLRASAIPSGAGSPDVAPYVGPSVLEGRPDSGRHGSRGPIRAPYEGRDVLVGKNEDERVLNAHGPGVGGRREAKGSGRAMTEAVVARPTEDDRSRETGWFPGTGRRGKTLTMWTRMGRARSLWPPGEAPPNVLPGKCCFSGSVHRQVTAVSTGPQVLRLEVFGTPRDTQSVSGANTTT